MEFRRMYLFMYTYISVILVICNILIYIIGIRIYNENTYLYLFVPSSLVWKSNLEALEAWVFSNFLPLLPRYRHFISAFRCLSLASVINKACLERFTSRCRRSNPDLIRRFSLYTEDWPEFGTQKDGNSVNGLIPRFFFFNLHSSWSFYMCF